MYYQNQDIKFNLISFEEEKDLFRRYRKGDEEAREKIIRNHLLLVRNIALRVAGKRDDQDSIISEANVALLKAMAHFKPSEGYRFSTFLHKYILGAVHRYMSNCSKGRARVALLDDLCPEDSLPAETLVEDDHETDDLHEHIREVLNRIVPKLPKKDRIILQMRYFENASLSQIAETLGDISIEGVRWRHSRLMVKLRKMVCAMSDDLKNYE